MWHKSFAFYDDLMPVKPQVLGINLNKYVCNSWKRPRKPSRKSQVPPQNSVHRGWGQMRRCTAANSLSGNWQLDSKIYVETQRVKNNENGLEQKCENFHY